MLKKLFKMIFYDKDICVNCGAVFYDDMREINFYCDKCLAEFNKDTICYCDETELTGKHFKSDH